jgi:hypothetical protein
MKSGLVVSAYFMKTLANDDNNAVSWSAFALAASTAFSSPEIVT